MFRKILVGYLENEHGQEALALGDVLARATGAEMAVVTAPEGGDLAELARTEHGDLVVLGPTHRGPMANVIPGATVEHLLGEAPCAVAVAPPKFGAGEGADGSWQPLDGDGEDAGLRIIGVGYDDSAAAKEALATASELALRNGAALRVYTVTDGPGPAPAEGDPRHSAFTARAEALRDALHQAVAGLPSETRALPVVLHGDPALELVKAAKVGVDLLVLGSRRGGPVRRMLHQSVTSRVIQDGTCPVLIWPASTG